MTWPTYLHIRIDDDENSRHKQICSILDSYRVTYLKTWFKSAIPPNLVGISVFGSGTTLSIIGQRLESPYVTLTVCNHYGDDIETMIRLIAH